MISFGPKKTASTSHADQIRAWAASALEGSAAFAEDVTLMVAELECREPGCPPVETVVSVLDKANPQKVKIIKAMADVEQADVAFAVERLKAEAEAAPITVHIKTPVGTCVDVTTQALETICDLKAKAAAAAGIPAERLRLMYLGRPMTDHMPVAQTGLKDGCTIEHGVGAAYFWQGEGTLAVSMALHAKNRARLLEQFKSAKDVPPNSFVILEGGNSSTRYDSDHEPVFRQESFFHWAFGVTEPDCIGVIDIDSSTTILFIPRLPAEYAVWMGKIKTCADQKLKYGVDEVRYVDELDAYFTEKDGAPPSPPAVLYTLKGQNTDSGSWAKEASFDGIEKYRVDSGKLFPIIVELRVFKTEEEMEVLRYVTDVTCKAHMEVMRQIRPGLREYQMESLFQHYVYEQGGCRNCAYTCICATGPNPAVLHYGHAGAPNARMIKEGDIGLYDMGAEYHCYCSDITSTFPASGSFNPEQRLVYQAVLDAGEAGEATMKPGTNWADMHRLAWRVMMQGLLDMGVLCGSLDAIMEARVPELFMACGLGHFIGLDTHDVGGYPRGVQRIDEPGIRALR
jgi:Xaa-Pro dipeptidase